MIDAFDHTRAVRVRASFGEVTTMPPFGFDDSQIDQLLTAAAVVPREKRAAFVTAVTTARAGTEVGAGSLHRVIANLQPEFLNVPDMAHGKGLPKHARRG